MHIDTARVSYDKEYKQQQTRERSHFDALLSRRFSGRIVRRAHDPPRCNIEFLIFAPYHQTRVVSHKHLQSGQGTSRSSDRHQQRQKRCSSVEYNATSCRPRGALRRWPCDHQSVTEDTDRHSAFTVNLQQFNISVPRRTD